jgi:hypothetical protein
MRPAFQGEVGIVEETFSIPNPYTHAVTIDDISTSCGCTSAALADKVVGPGSHTSLKMTADLGRKRGLVQILCKLKASTGERWTCSLLTHLYPRLDCSPAQFSFGVVEPRQDAEIHGTVSVYSQDEVPPTPAVSTPHPASGLSASLGDSSIEPLPDHFAVRRLPVILRRRPEPSVAYGPSNSLLQLAIESHGQRFDLAVPVTYAIRSSFEIRPARAFFGQVSRRASPPEKQIIVRRVDKQPFRIESFTATNPLFRATCEECESGREWRIHILLDSVGLSQDQRFVFGELHLGTDRHDEPRMTIALAADVH